MNFLPYGKQTVTQEDLAAVAQVLLSPHLTQGPTVAAFEQAVATKVEAYHGVAVNSATSALHVACLALGLGDGDRLWTSTNTFVASANCARYCGADVDFVDIDEDTGLMCMKDLAQKLEKAERIGNLPKIVVPVHLTGASCNMAMIGALAKRYGFAVIEDASHAIGGQYQNEPVGNCRHSDITVFSFHPVKIITAGEGGVATTNSDYLAQCMADLRSHGITKDETRFQLPCHGPWSYEQQMLGFNYRMTDIQAALGLSQLERLEDIVAERNHQLKYYEKLLDGMEIELLKIPEGVLSSVHLAVIKLKEVSAAKHQKIFKQLREKKIGVQLHYSPVHLQPYYRNLGFREGQFPAAEAYAKSAMSIPLYPGLTEEEQKRVVEILHELTRTI